MNLDLARVSAEDVVAAVRRKIRARRQGLIDSGIDDYRTRNLIRALGDVFIGVYDHREVRVRLATRRGNTRPEDVCPPALDVDLAALGMPRKLADTARIDQVSESAWALRWGWPVMSSSIAAIGEIEATTRDIVGDMDTLETLISRMKRHGDDVAQLADQLHRLGLTSDERTAMVAVAVRRYKAAAEGLGEAKFSLAIAAAKVKEINNIVH